MAVLNKGELAERIIKDKLVEVRDAKHQLQPASVDLTLEKIYRFVSQGAIDFDNSQRVLSKVEEISFQDSWAELKQGAYKVQYAETVRVPPDLAGITFCRSTLSRCGCDVYNGWWDPGYVGKGEGMLFVMNPHGVRLKKGAKIAQIVFLKLSTEANELYEGMHKGENL